MLISSPFFALCALSALGLLLLLRLIRCLSSPLRSLPGPPSSLFTSLVLRWRELGAGRTAYIHGLHRQYGSVVRVAPNEVSFTSWLAIKEIYCSGGSGYDKSDFYDMFKIFGRRTMFTMLNRADHAKRKRIIADRYANFNVMRGLALDGIQHRSRTFLRRCASASQSQTSNIFTALHAYACDCVTHHLFHPHGSDCLESQADQDMMHQVTADDSIQNRLIEHHYPILHRLFARLLRLFIRPREVPLVDDYVWTTIKHSDVAPFTLLSRFKDKGGLVDSTDVAAECLDHMVAGIDTTGDSLCFLMWELSQPRSVSYQRRLTEELRSNSDTPIEQLPFLDAVVNEALRCYPAIPMSLPRVVPRGGRSVDGVWLPAQTVVSCQPYSVHRIDERVFPDPDVFDPDRWLRSEGDQERRRLLFAFSNGGRGCIGKHLALAEMKTLLRDVYSAFSTQADSSMTEQSMAMSDQLISTQPLGRRCLLQFRPIDEAGVCD
ncbi:Cytochrome P450 [Ophiocordyceps camponoti-floridani]|uniref:Cytochrome P450 n=1 Tax=Ophiocordyceps camponoti-floridani TaxID=2030778 RepID=A0A8H4Q9C7_9HYPO|nr:Cytochrome P450 [Ophiocordyceps camponoti-floridani]